MLSKIDKGVLLVAVHFLNQVLSDPRRLLDATNFRGEEPTYS
jgi:hypothetical protein